MMGSVCDEQQHRHSHHLIEKPSPHGEVDIPQRNLLAGRNSMESPNAQSSRILPSNNPLSSDSDDPYSSDHFRMYEFKIQKCGLIRSHDWIECPFAHKGEKAIRRDPRRFPYSSTVCPHFRKGRSCSRGERCEFSHGVFESWLHPSRYRTEACRDGKNCNRKICFFAHSASQLRMLPVPETHPSPPPVERKAAYFRNNNELNSNCPHSASHLRILPETHPSPPPVERKAAYFRNNNELNSNCNLCVFCRSITASPTSTQRSMSPISRPASPMFSPQVSQMSPYDRRRAGLHEFIRASGMSHEEAMMELMASYDDAMTVSEARPGPSTPVRVGPSQLNRGGFSGGRNLMEDDRYNRGGSSSSNLPNMERPDLDWDSDFLT